MKIKISRETMLKALQRVGNIVNTRNTLPVLSNLSGGTRTIVTLPESVYDNWVYLTAVFDGATSAVYENGVPVSTNAINAVNANTSYALCFAENLTGRIDEYRIHNRVDDAAYIAADYATQTDPEFLTFGEIQNHSGFFILVR